MIIHIGFFFRISAVLLIYIGMVTGCSSDVYFFISIKEPFETPDGDITVTFSVTADIRDFATNDILYFRGVCDRIFYGGKGDFMISPGDIDPPDKIYETITQYIDADYIWYPVVGNHELEPESDMEWLRDFNPNGNTLPNIVNTGPAGTEETTYSFDWANAHFVVINEYYDGVSDIGAVEGDITDPLYSWIEADLTTNTQPVVLVFGHEPAYPQPDKENGRIRHVENSLNLYPENRDRFWNLLKTHGVKAYICGHTHNYSTYLFDGVMQVDAGHARGYGDTGAKSTFVMFYVMADNSVWFYTYRLTSWSYLLYEKILIE